MKKSQDRIKDWWEDSSKWYQKDAKIHTRAAHYGPYAPDEDKLRLLGKVKGKKILEIGCGGGQCSIAFAKEGANVTGVDISEEQLKYAENLAKKNKVKVKFVQSDVQTLKQFKSNGYDIVFSTWALQYIPDLKKCFKEVHRILKKNGLFVFSFGHPFHENINPKTTKLKYNYNKPGKVVETETWADGKKHTFIMFKRRISDIYDAIVESGLTLEKILEPVKLKGQKAWTSDPFTDDFSLKLAKMVPPTIIFKTRKK
ncbi:MAG: class I SAM-dependent methyltransferase [Candidatus Aenigmarchaeota archaeon]|nr:class I SAM-dependent methyltransferase [Candidatus Aenigmarchaeota archaeon]